MRWLLNLKQRLQVQIMACFICWGGLTFVIAAIFSLFLHCIFNLFVFPYLGIFRMFSLLLFIILFISFCVFSAFYCLMLHVRVTSFLLAS